MASLTRRQSAPGTNERKYPHIVQLAVGPDGLDVELGRRILDFHNSEHIKLRGTKRTCVDSVMALLGREEAPLAHFSKGLSQNLD